MIIYYVTSINTEANKYQHTTYKDTCGKTLLQLAGVHVYPNRCEKKYCKGFVQAEALNHFSTGLTAK